jgi:hypothetical protein
MLAGDTRDRITRLKRPLPGPWLPSRTPAVRPPAVALMPVADAIVGRNADRTYGSSPKRSRAASRPHGESDRAGAEDPVFSPWVRSCGRPRRLRRRRRFGSWRPVELTGRTDAGMSEFVR